MLRKYPPRSAVPDFRRRLRVSALMCGLLLTPGYILRGYLSSSFLAGADIFYNTSGFLLVVAQPLIVYSHIWQCWFNKNCRFVVSFRRGFPVPKSVYVVFAGVILTWLVLSFNWLALQGDRFNLPGMFSTLINGLANEAVIAIITLQFYTCVEGARKRISLILKDHPQDVLTWINTEYDLLRKIERVADFYAPQLTAICFTAFCYALLHTFRVINAFNKVPLQLNLGRLGIVCLPHLFLFLAVSVIHNFHCTVRAFRAKVFRTVMNSRELCANRSLCTHLLLKKSVKFSACGLFPIGYPIITSIIAATSSYLVMLIQLGGHKN